MTTPNGELTAFFERIYELAARRNRRYDHRWVLSLAHVQALHDMVNEQRRAERARLALIPAQLPGFDPTEYIKWNEPLPPPDRTKADEWRLLGWPIRIDDVDDITLEVVKPAMNIEWVDEWEES